MNRILATRSCRLLAETIATRSYRLLKTKKVSVFSVETKNSECFSVLDLIENYNFGIDLVAIFMCVFSLNAKNE